MSESFYFICSLHFLGDFFGDFTGDFFTTVAVFLTGDFLTADLAAGFLTGDFFATTFLTAVFLAIAFDFSATFLAAGDLVFLAAVFLGEAAALTGEAIFLGETSFLGEEAVFVFYFQNILNYLFSDFLGCWFLYSFLNRRCSLFNWRFLDWRRFGFVIRSQFKSSFGLKKDLLRDSLLNCDIQVGNISSWKSLLSDQMYFYLVIGFNISFDSLATRSFFLLLKG